MSTWSITLGGLSRFRFLIALIFTLSVVQAGIITNGEFETGDLSGWTLSGDGSASVLTGLGPLSPPQGLYFALLGNGPGDVNFDELPDVATLSSNQFVVPSAGGTLMLKYSFLTAEFTGTSSDPTRLDSFLITLGNTTLASGDVSLNTFQLISNGNPVSAPDGSSFFEYIAFRTLSIPISAGTYTLQFQVADAGDGNFDSGLLIDSVGVQANTSGVPEPRSVVFLSAGLAALAAMKLKRTRRTTTTH